MSYKNFQVCKEVYIPIKEGDVITLDEYKEKYGIDLNDYFNFSETKSEMTLKTHFNYPFKLNFVELTTNRVIPIMPYEEGDIKGFIFNYIFDTDTSISAYSYLSWNYSDKTLQLVDF